MEVTFVEIQSVFLALFQLQQSAITSRPASYANVRCFVRHLSATLTWFNLVPATAGSDQLCPGQRVFVDHDPFPWLARHPSLYTAASVLKNEN